MNPILVRKTKLLEKLRENRANHHAIFQEAVKGYTKLAEEHLRARLEEILKGRMVSIMIHLPLPVDHTRDYDRVIQMVEMDAADDPEATIMLSETDFAQYVMDDWAWKRQFLTANSAYSTTARMAAGKEDE